MKFTYNYSSFNFKYLINKLLFIVVGLLVMSCTLSLTLNYSDYVKFSVSFFDTGTLMSLLMCLEHIFVCYYLIIMLVMVYWSLYVFTVDFSEWNVVYKYNNLGNFISFILESDSIFYSNLFFFFYSIFLSFVIFFKEMESILFLNYTHMNFTMDKYIPLHILGLFPYHFKKAYLNQKNMVNILSNFLKDSDFFGSPFILTNYGGMKFVVLLSLLNESINLLKKNYNYSNNKVNENMNNYLFSSIAKSFFFFSEKDSLNYNNKTSFLNLNYNKYMSSIRALYNNVFEANQFKHSGMFEAVWAAFPTMIMISMLMPSLILLYSFEDMLNPKMSVKVMGNQWYWTYEFDNWMSYNKKELDGDYEKALLNSFVSSNEDIGIAKSVYTSYAFNSVMVDLNSLEMGNKSLLEVDNSLVLSTNLTTSFLVGSADVLHSFSVADLGFKVDATPGSLNQMLTFMSSPGVYYGQCSELCGTNHGFMPIVIQAVTPTTYLNYMDKINSIDFEEVEYSDDAVLENEDLFMSNK